MAIDKKRIALIHVAKKALDMEDPAYRAMLVRVAGIATSADLDEAAFDRVMAEFERLGFRSTRGRATAARREGMASPAQLGKIRALWKEHSGNDDERRLCHWLEVHLHVSHPRFLEGWRAGKAVGILRKMAERKAAKNAAALRKSTEVVR